MTYQAPDVDSGRCERDDLPEIEVTDAMVRAGRVYLDSYDPEKHSAWEVLPRLFSAMWAARSGADIPLADDDD